MTTETETEGTEQETPKDLRDRMEAAIAGQRAAESKLATYETKEFLVEKKFDLVKPEDLTGVVPAEREAKAAEIQASRKAMQDGLLRDALKASGFDEDTIEEMVTNGASVTAATEDAEAATRIRAVGALPGTVVPAVNPAKLHAEDAMHAFFEQQAKGSKRK